MGVEDGKGFGGVASLGRALEGVSVRQLRNWLAVGGPVVKPSVKGRGGARSR